jgi:ubiquinone/menaquinone biosynthesis C-methylase UbiE
VIRRVVVLGAAAAERAAADEADEADEVIVVDPSPRALLDALGRLADPRVAFLLGELPVLPLPDGWVDAVVGAENGHPELDRISR